MHCKICGNKITHNTMCNTCGFDQSQDYETYPTLCALSHLKKPSIRKLKIQYQTTLTPPQSTLQSSNQVIAPSPSHKSSHGPNGTEGNKLIHAVDSIQQKGTQNIKNLSNTLATILKNKSGSTHAPAEPPLRNDLHGTYYDDRPVRGLNNRIIEEFMHAAKSGDLSAKNNIGYCYSHGIKFPKDAAEASSWYLMAANPTEPPIKKQVTVREGYVWRTKEVVVDSPSQKYGDPVAQYNLGHCYENGKGLRKDISSAISWYLKSAKQGNTEAHKKLQEIVVSGIGTHQDYSHIVSWLSGSEMKNDPTAQCALGDCYFYGRGLSHNYYKAAELYREAAETKGGLMRVGYEWVTTPIIPGHRRAQFQLGYCYEHGLGVTKNEAEAQKWYRLARNEV